MATPATVPVLNAAFGALSSAADADNIRIENNVASNEEVNSVVRTLTSTSGLDFHGASAVSQGAALTAFAIAAANQGASQKTRYAGSYNLQDSTPAFLRTVHFARIAAAIKLTPCDTSETGLLSVRRFCRRFANLVYDHFRRTGTFPAGVKPNWPDNMKLISFDFSGAINHPDALPLPAGRPSIILTDNQRLAIDANSRVLIGRARAQENGQRVTNAHELLNGQLTIAAT